MLWTRLQRDTGVGRDKEERHMGFHYEGRNRIRAPARAQTAVLVFPPPLFTPTFSFTGDTHDSYSKDNILDLSTDSSKRSFMLKGSWIVSFSK